MAGASCEPKLRSPGDNFREISRGLRVLGVSGVIYMLGGLLPIRGIAKSKWYLGIPAEVAFWDKFFATKGLFWHDDYARRLDPDLPLQKHVRDLLPRRADVDILDVGAGPLTVLGKKCKRKSLRITAVDALANEYDKILRSYRIIPLVRTQKVVCEKLTGCFVRNTFDLVYARNSIDHSYNPEQAILEMVSVVKPNCYVLLEHYVNEGETHEYHGLHQWNLSETKGQFIIRGKKSETNVTEKYSGLCYITCEIVEAHNPARGRKVPWLIVRMRKN